jgi:hypothetical protein
MCVLNFLVVTSLTIVLKLTCVCALYVCYSKVWKTPLLRKSPAAKARGFYTLILEMLLVTYAVYSR